MERGTNELGSASMLCSALVKEGGPIRCTQALGAAREPPQEAPEITGSHLVVTINRECLWPSWPGGTSQYKPVRMEMRISRLSPGSGHMGKGPGTLAAWKGLHPIPYGPATGRRKFDRSG